MSDEAPFTVADLGFRPIDEGHQRQARLVREIEQALADEAQPSPARIESLLLELVAHTREHFGAEQALMRAWSFPAAADHEREHDALLDYVQGMAEAHSSGRSLLTLAAARALRPWLERHIAGMDSALVAHVRMRLVPE